MLSLFDEDVRNTRTLRKFSNTYRSNTSRSIGFEVSRSRLGTRFGDRRERSSISLRLHLWSREVLLGIEHIAAEETA